MPIVKLKNVKKTYDLGKVKVPALRGLDLEIRKGEFFIIKGKSGSGKSTALNIIGAMDVASSGEVIIAQQDVNKLNDKQLSNLRKHHIGFIFQSFNLIPVLNALENVEYPLRLQGDSEYREKSIETLRQCGLQDFMKHKPNELSGGQRQRVAIARALVAKPDIILADEPTANLDSKTSDQIMNLMWDLQHQNKSTFIVASHHEALLERASRLVELKDGKIYSDC